MSLSSRGSTLPLGCVYLGLLALATQFLLQPPRSMAQDDRSEKTKTENAKNESLGKQVAKLAEDLDSDRKAIRDSSEAKLIELGPEVIEFLPAVTSKSSDEFRMRLDRVRVKLEEIQFKLLSKPSTVTLKGSMSGREALMKISSQTKNMIAMSELPTLEKVVTTEFEETPFWEAFDEILDQLDLTVPMEEVDSLRLMQRANHAPLRIAMAGYSGAFRVEPLEINKTLRLHDPSQNSGHIQFLVSWEPRLNPVFVRFPREAIKLVCDNGKVLQLRERQESEFVPDSGPQLTVTLDIDLPSNDAKKITRWSGDFQVAIPGAMAKIEFADLMKANRESAKVGHLSVVCEKARKNRDIYEVLICVSLESEQNSAESFRGWSNINEAYLLDKDNKRVDHVGWSTTRMTENEVGLSYLFDVDKGLDGYRFVFKAPASLYNLTLPFVVEDIPLP